MRAKRLAFESERHPRLTHYAFRYPAKFHPPVVRELLDCFTESGQWILDPFCGSGTLLVEAVVTGRNAIGTDIDPVASFVARQKVHSYDVSRLKTSWRTLQARLAELQRPDYERLVFEDITQYDLLDALATESLWVPSLPNIDHWFRRYVILDLARILAAIENLSVPSTHENLFRLCFAACLRSCSNADPVPVSGLEVTKYMLTLSENGRLIDPFAEFAKSTRKALMGIEELARHRHPSAAGRAFQADATTLSSRLRRRPDAVITSPPYQGAVEYYRRHTLEMYWLGLTKSHSERLSLLQKYIGRPRVARSHSFVQDVELPALARRWEQRIRSHSSKRADSFKHYVVGMGKCFDQLSQLLPPGAPAIFVLGRSSWNGASIPTDKLFTELADSGFALTDKYWYPIKNRYMSYSRHNGANIDKEHVLVFCRRGAS